MTKKKAAEEIVDAEFDAPAEEAPPDDPVIFGGAGFLGGSSEMTIAEFSRDATAMANELEADLSDPDIVDHLAPVRAEAEVCYQAYHDTLRGLPVVEWPYLSPAQQSAWMSVAQRSLEQKAAE